MKDLAVPLPVTMISELLGIESDMLDTFKGWTDTVVESISTNEGRADRLAEGDLLARDDPLNERSGEQNIMHRRNSSHHCFVVPGPSCSRFC